MVYVRGDYETESAGLMLLWATEEEPPDFIIRLPRFKFENGGTLLLLLMLLLPDDEAARRKLVWLSARLAARKTSIKEEEGVVLETCRAGLVAEPRLIP